MGFCPEWVEFASAEKEMYLEFCYLEFVYYFSERMDILLTEMDYSLSFACPFFFLGPAEISLKSSLPDSKYGLWNHFIILGQGLGYTSSPE